MCLIRQSSGKYYASLRPVVFEETFIYTMICRVLSLGKGEGVDMHCNILRMMVVLSHIFNYIYIYYCFVTITAFF